MRLILKIITFIIYIMQEKIYVSTFHNLSNTFISKHLIIIIMSQK